MAEENENAETVETETVESETVETETEEPKLNKTQLQQISSVTGNIVKGAIEKAIKDDVLPMLQQRQVETNVPASDTPAYQKFNEKLAEKFFAGDISGAFQDYLNVHEKANQNITKRQKTDLNKHLSSYEDKPHYKDVFSDMEKLANKFMENGYPAGPAAELAYEKSVNSHLTSKPVDNTGNLAMETGGRRTVSVPTGKLPPDFERSYQQGKAKGLFKDRKDYIENLDPRIRAQYGIA